MKSTDKRLWANRNLTARLLGVSGPTLDTVRSRMAVDDVRGGKGRALSFHIPATVAALIEHKLEGAKSQADPLLAGGDSPALERYREARASREELALEKEQATHVSILDLDNTLVRFGSLLRRHGEILQRRFGPEAADIFNNALDESANIIKAEFEKPKAQV